MRIAILSDIHGNEAALKAVLADARKRSADRIACLGDVVSFGPFPGQCLDALFNTGKTVCVRGNHDRYVSDEIFRTDAFSQRWSTGFVNNEAWTYSQLTLSHLEVLRSLPPQITFTGDGCNVTLVHATLASDDVYLPPDAPDAEFATALGETGVRGCGHTHLPFVRRVRETLYINPGSVGMPFDYDNRAAYAMLDVVDGEAKAETIRVGYNMETTLKGLAKFDVPWRKHFEAALKHSMSFFDPRMKGILG